MLANVLMHKVQFRNKLGASLHGCFHVAMKEELWTERGKERCLLC